jgi:hypothetical protein
LHRLLLHLLLLPVCTGITMVCNSCAASCCCPALIVRNVPRLLLLVKIGQVFQQVLQRG